jgi:aspartate-semialdehyde dehydrogenase
MKVAVVGATGLVGTKMMALLESRNFPVSELIPVASENSVGKTVVFKGKEITVTNIRDAISRQPELALFSAGGSTSLEWAPEFAKNGTTVIDNSSAWRMKKHIPLIVPEVNAHILTNVDKIIANPNCSTIQLVLILHPLHQTYGVKRVVVSTYQSVTGTGAAAVQQLNNERLGKEGNKVYPYPIDLNVIPQIDVFMENGYTKEEMKMTNETKKILGDDSIKLTATCVRIPVTGGHSESVNIECMRPVDISAIRTLLSNAPGVVVQDDPTHLLYPMPLFSTNKDETFVGRIRTDETQPNTFNCWVVSDNLRKGAATNALQIAEYLLEKNML